MPRKKAEKLTPVPVPRKRAGKHAETQAPAPPDLSHIAESLRPLAVPLADVAFMLGNAVKHPDKQVEELRASLRTFGQVEAIVVNRRESPPVVIGGNGRLQAMLAENWTHGAVCFVDLPRAKANALSLALNRTADGKEWDREALDKLLRDVDTANDPALDAMLAELARQEKLYLTPDGEQPEAPEEIEPGAEAEDSLDLIFKAPFPWFGGKARVARLVWKRFGAVQSYVEPFFGSGAMLLNRPSVEGVETVNDYDGLVANFWRAVQADPEAVAHHADWPVNENDLHARHAWLVANKETLQAALEGSPEHYDAKIAGWWCWGMACWIGSGFCSGNGPWQVVEAEDGTRQLVHLGNAGQGVNRQRVHLGDAGQGDDSATQGEASTASASTSATQDRAGLGECGLLPWMQALSERLRRVRVCCGDWTRVCGGDGGDALRHLIQQTPCGVFLDPPYADTADRDPTLYRKDSGSVAHKVREWAITHGDDERLRIALCGYEGEHQMPANWKCVAWKASGGYGNQGDVTKGRENSARERIWFSKFCLDPD